MCILSNMYSIWTLLTYYIRPLMKWFLRKTTGLCELQRICYGEVSGAPRTKAVENSLNLSRTLQIKHLVSYLNNLSDCKKFRTSDVDETVKFATSTVLFVKKINPRIHPQFIKVLTHVFCTFGVIDNF